MSKAIPQTIFQQIYDTIEASMESTIVRDAIAAHAVKRVGKRITKTDAEQLEQQLGVRVRLHQLAGMLSIEWAISKDPNASWVDNSTSMLIVYGTTNLVWPRLDEIKKRAACWFDALDERNVARQNAITQHRLSKTSGSDAFGSSWIERAAKAVYQIREAQRELETLTDYGNPLSVVQFDIKKLVENS